MTHRTAAFQLGLGLVFAFLASAPTADAADPRVEFVLIQTPGAPINTARKWIDTLKRAGVRSVQVRSARTGETLRVEQKGSDQFRQISVRTLRRH